jgi:hypothetical protein
MTRHGRPSDLISSEFVSHLSTLETKDRTGSSGEKMTTIGRRS